MITSCCRLSGVITLLIFWCACLTAQTNISGTVNQYSSVSSIDYPGNSVTVADQADNEYFTLERSTDGRAFAALGRVAATEATTYTFTDHEPLTTRWFDRYVFHPRTTYQYGRPDYVYANGQVPVYVDCKQLELSGPFLLQAYGEKDDLTKAVPRDVVETSTDKPIALALLPGQYQLLVTVPDGRQFIAAIDVA